MRQSDPDRPPIAATDILKILELSVVRYWKKKTAVKNVLWSVATATSKSTTTGLLITEVDGGSLNRNVLTYQKLFI